MRLLCIALAAVLLLEVVLKIASRNPVSGLKIPALPTVTAEADSGGGKATNNPSGKAAEAQAGSKATNSLAAGQTNGLGTNLVGITSSTQAVHSAHHSVKRKGDTNQVAAQKAALTETNAVDSRPHGTNGLAESAASPAGSNTLAHSDSGDAGTNSVRSKSSGKGTNASGRAEMAMNGTNGSGRPGMMGKRAPDLPLPILARVDRVVDSELFGPVFHPMPAGLLGIAGNLALLRASNGQTGVVKEGDELGGLKLLRIGINRVLVEEDGQKKELMIFNGLGGQSLLPQ